MMVTVVIGMDNKVNHHFDYWSIHTHTPCLYLGLHLKEPYVYIQKALRTSLYNVPSQIILALCPHFYKESLEEC